jgi:hypothetical protein
MRLSKLWILYAITVLDLMAVAGKAQAQIGMVVSKGNFTIAGVRSAGTATIFDGDLVATGSVASEVHLSNGVDLMMSPNSSGSIFQDHVNLIKGTIAGKVGGQYRVASEGLVLQPTSSATRAEVQVADNRVIVALPAGQADMLTAHGALVSHMVPGKVLSYQNVNGADDKVVQALGVLDRQDGHYLIRDRFTNVVSELSGDIPANYLNKLVLVNGELLSDKPTVSQVDRLVMVKQIKRSDATSAVPCESDPGGSVAEEMKVDGVLSTEKGHYLVATSEHGYVEVIGDVDSAEVGKTVHMKGAIIQGHTAYAPAEQVVYTEKRKFVVSDSPCAGLIAGGVMVAASLLLHPDDGSQLAPTPISY